MYHTANSKDNLKPEFGTRWSEYRHHEQSDGAITDTDDEKFEERSTNESYTPWKELKHAPY